MAKRIGFALVKEILKIYQDFKLYREDGTETIYSPYSILALGIKELEFRDDFPPHLSGYLLFLDQTPKEQEQYFTTSKNCISDLQPLFKMGKRMVKLAKY